MWLLLLIALSVMFVLLPQRPRLRVGVRSDGRLAPVAETNLQTGRERYGGTGELTKFVTRLTDWGQQLKLLLPPGWQRD